MGTDIGLNKVYEHWSSEKYGLCPRHLCRDLLCSLIPVSVCPSYEHLSLKYYCFSCRNIYHNKITKSRNMIDGISYHPLLLHKFMLRYPEKMPNQEAQEFVPQLFGFDIHPEVFKTEESMQEI